MVKHALFINPFVLSSYSLFDEEFDFNYRIAFLFDKDRYEELIKSLDTLFFNHKIADEMDMKLLFERSDFEEFVNELFDIAKDFNLVAFKSKDYNFLGNKEAYDEDKYFRSDLITIHNLVTIYFFEEFDGAAPRIDLFLGPKYIKLGREVLANRVNEIKELGSDRTSLNLLAKLLEKSLKLALFYENLENQLNEKGLKIKAINDRLDDLFYSRTKKYKEENDKFVKAFNDKFNIK